MPKFSPSSNHKLSTCHPDLQMLFQKIIQKFDCTIVEGHRNMKNQDRLFDEGKSKLQWPNSKHNTIPSKGVDVAPFVNGKVSWDERQCTFFAGYVMATAQHLGINIRWGGDWDQDLDIKDQTFNDLVHFEVHHQKET